MEDFETALAMMRKVAEINPGRGDVRVKIEELERLAHPPLPPPVAIDIVQEDEEE